MKIYLCTTAPSKNYRSWSNIPYLLHNSLEKQGYIVKNCVMREIEPFRTLFNLPIRALNKLFKVGTTYFYVRTPLHFFFANMYGRFIGLISNSKDVMVVQGFSYPLNNGKNRQIIVGDWPSEYLFEKFMRRKPSHLERKSIDRENAVIEAADSVITLFPNVQEYMLKKYKNPNIYCFGNVVNIDDAVVLPSDILDCKLRSKRLVFIGQTFYLPGAHALIEAVANMRQKGIECEVDIIGIDKGLIGCEYEWLFVHGYLDKDKPDEKSKYYRLLTNARMFVNTTPGWSGFQALLEAMYFYNPVVVRRNECLTSYFCDLPSVAYILEEGGQSLESLLIQGFASDGNYRKMSIAAHEAVNSSTWANFTSKLVGLI